MYQRSDGRWVAALDLGIHNGKRKRLVRYAKNKTEAREHLRSLQRQREDGINLLAGSMTLTDYLEQWLTMPHQQGLASSTQQCYAEKIHIHILPYIGTIKLEHLKKTDVEDLVTILQKKERQNLPKPKKHSTQPQKVTSSKHNTTLSNRTVALTISILRAALNWAKNEGIIARNVAKTVTIPKDVTHDHRVLTCEEARAFLAAVAGHRLDVLYHMALKLGMRQGEILALTWDDVDLERGLVFIRKSKTPSGKRSLELCDSPFVSPGNVFRFFHTSVPPATSTGNVRVRS